MVESKAASIRTELESEVAPMVEPAYSLPGKKQGTLEVAHKLRFVLLLAAVAVAGYVIPGPSTQFVKLSFFAAVHGGGDCQLVPSSDPCRKASSDVTLYHGISSAVAHSVAWLAALLTGSYSDIYGRRPLLIIAASLSLVSRFSLAAHLFGGASLWIFLVVEPALTVFDIRGVLLAVMSDVIANPGSRVIANTVTMAVALGAAGFAGIAGSLLSARSAVILSLSLVILQIYFLVTHFPETAPIGRHAEAIENTGNLCINPMFVVRDATRLLLRNSHIIRVTLILLFSFLSSAGFHSTFIPYLTGYLGFTQKTNGQLMMVCGVSVAVSFLVGMKPLLARFGNIGAIRICLALKVVYVLLCAFARSPWQVFLVHALLLGPVVLMVPVMTALQSNLVDESEQGQMLGILAAVKILATAVGELCFAWFYKYATAGGANPSHTALLPPLFTVTGFAVIASLVAYSLNPVDSNIGREPQREVIAADSKHQVAATVVGKRNVNAKEIEL